MAMTSEELYNTSEVVKDINKRLFRRKPLSMAELVDIIFTINNITGIPAFRGLEVPRISVGNDGLEARWDHPERNCYVVVRRSIGPVHSEYIHRRTMRL